MNIQQPVRNREQESFLKFFLESPARPANTMNFYQLDGYLRAVGGGPGLSAVDEWMPSIFNDESAQYLDDTEAQRFMAAVIALYNFHVGQAINCCCDLPLQPVYTEDRAQRTNLEQWARGFLRGYIYWEECWNEYIDQVPLGNVQLGFQAESLADELDAVLYIISTIADADLAVAQNTDPKDLEGIFECLPESVLTYGAIGRAVYEYDLANTNSQKTHPLPEQFVRESAKVGRNDSCPCGSGQKFKKCCLH